MAEFKVGGRVICIDNGSNGMGGRLPPIIKGRVYTVWAISFSPCCKQMILDIGIPAISEKTNCPCKKKYSNKNVWWLRAARFLPLDDFKEVTFEKIKEQVPVGAQ